MDDDGLTPEADELARRCAHVFLDLVAAVEPEGPVDQLPAGWANTLVAELNDLGAVTLVVDDATGQKHLDLTAIAAGLVMVIEPLIDSIATQRGVDRLAVIGSVRVMLDEIYGSAD